MKPEERKRDIVEKAVNILALDGPGEFTLRGVADRCGIRLSSLQYHFPNKRDLFDAIHHHVLEKYHENMDRALSHEGDPSAQLHEFIDAFILWERDPVIMRLQPALMALSLTDEEMKRSIGRARNEALKRFARIVRLVNPQLDETAARDRAILIIGMINGSLSLVGERGHLRERRKPIVAQLKRIAERICLDDEVDAAP